SVGHPARGFSAEAFDSGAPGSRLLAGIQGFLSLDIHRARCPRKGYLVRPIASLCLRRRLEKIRAAMGLHHPRTPSHVDVAGAGNNTQRLWNSGTRLETNAG